MKKIIFSIISAIIMSSALTGCYDCDDDGNFGARIVHELKTLPPIGDGISVELRGETEMDSHIFFQLCSDKDFIGSKIYVSNLETDTIDQEIKTARIGYEYAGTFYYRLCASSGNDTIYAGNVEPFTIENPLTTFEPTDITLNSAVLQGYSKTNNFTDASRYFLLSSSSDFTDAKRYDMSTGQLVDETGGWEYQAYPKDLYPSSTYYCKFCEYYYISQNTVEGNTIQFSTEEGSMLKIGDIKGLDYIESFADNEISLFMSDNHETWNRRTIKFTDFTNGNFRIYLEEGKEYNVKIFNENATTDNGYYTDLTYVKFRDNGTWEAFYGECNVTSQDPVINTEIKPMFAKLSLIWPSSEGTDDIDIMSIDNIIPKYEFSFLTNDFYKSTYLITCMGFFSTSLPYTFYIPAFKIEKENQVWLSRLGNVIGYFPVMDIEAGKEYVIDFTKKDSSDTALDVTDIYVNNWTDKDSGQIIITPQQ